MTHKETRSIHGIFSDITHRKRRSAESRFDKTSTAHESPRDVYLCACETIARAFEQSGYKYAKSGPHFRKQSGDFTFQVSFQSSTNNIAGEHVCLWIHGFVFSRRLKRWRKQQGNIHISDFVAGGQIGNLKTNFAWLEWELADPNNRDSAICDAVAAIEGLAIPYFGLFEDIPSLNSHLLDNELPSMEMNRAIEFLLCFSDQQTAKTAASNFLRRRPDLIQSYQQELQNYAERGLNSAHPSGYAKQLAFASHVFGFGDLAATEAEPSNAP